MLKQFSNTSTANCFLKFYLFFAPPTLSHDGSRNFTLEVLLSLTGNSGLLVVMEKLVFSSHDFTQVQYRRKCRFKIS